MLKGQKNLLLREVKSAGLDMGLFRTREVREAGEKLVFLELVESPLRFSILEADDSHNKFRHQHSRFLPNFPDSDLFPAQGWTDIEGVCVGLQHWLRGSVQRYLEELRTPDLWAGAIRSIGTWNLALGLHGSPESLGYAYDDFDEDQRTEIRKSLENLQEQIHTHLELPAAKLKIVEDRFAYLSEALDRLSRFDWWALLVYTMITIFIALALDTDRGERLLELLRKLFENLGNLLA